MNDAVTQYVFSQIIASVLQKGNNAMQYFIKHIERFMMSINKMA